MSSKIEYFNQVPIRKHHCHGFTISVELFSVLKLISIRWVKSLPWEYAALELRSTSNFYVGRAWIYYVLCFWWSWSYFTRSVHWCGQLVLCSLDPIMVWQINLYYQRRLVCCSSNTISEHFGFSVPNRATMSRMYLYHKCKIYALMLITEVILCFSDSNSHSP